MARILAIDLRAQRFGYSVLQSNQRLLDFGAAGFHSPRQVRQRVRVLLKAFDPSVVVLDTGATRGCKDKRRTASTIRAIRREARCRFVPVAVTRQRALRAFFLQNQIRSKYEFAALAASWFPQLAARVPPKRKCYDREPPVMTSFDSVALGLVYLTCRAD